MSSWGKRQLNAVSHMRNPLGEYFVFGQVGTGSSRTIVTLAHRRSQKAVMVAYHKYQRYIGDLMNDVPRE
jgi:hypothetical protein